MELSLLLHALIRSHIFIWIETLSETSRWTRWAVWSWSRLMAAAMQQRPPSTARFVGDDESKAEYDLNGIADCESNDTGKMMTGRPGDMRLDQYLNIVAGPGPLLLLCPLVSTLQAVHSHAEGLLRGTIACPQLGTEQYHLKFTSGSWRNRDCLRFFRSLCRGHGLLYEGNDSSRRQVNQKTTKQWMTMKVAKIKTQKTRIMMIKTAKKINSMQAWQQQNKRDLSWIER